MTAPASRRRWRELRRGPGRAAHRRPVSRRRRGGGRAAAARGPAPADRADRTDIPLVTIDPPGSTDLDQALHLTEHGDGLRVYYAIADIGAFAERGGVIEAEAWQRGVTAYGPDYKTPVYPSVLSEGAASLLPGGPRPAFLFTVDLDATGEGVAFAVERAMVESRRKLTYAEAQREGMPLLERLGTLREARANAARRDAARPAGAGGGARRPPARAASGCTGRSACRSRTGTRTSRCWSAWARPSRCSPTGSACCA